MSNNLVLSRMTGLLNTEPQGIDYSLRFAVGNLHQPGLDIAPQLGRKESRPENNTSRFVRTLDNYIAKRTTKTFASESLSPCRSFALACGLISEDTCNNAECEPATTQSPVDRYQNYCHLGEVSRQYPMIRPDEQFGPNFE
jgi:hypothetical protein